MTRAFPGATVRPPPQWLPFRSLYNVAATKLANQTVFQMLRPLTNECRHTVLGLPPLGAGYWFLDRPPVYVGYGSIVDHERQEMTRIVIGAIERSGQRAVLQAGWGGLEPDALPDSMLMVGDVPHEWLFPQLVAAIHHGGAGTTARA